MTLMVMTLVIPGSAQLVAGNRRLGRIAIRVWLAVVVAVLLSALVAAFAHSFVFWAGLQHPAARRCCACGLMALAVGWALLFIDAWRLGQPLGLQRQQRLAVVGVNGLLSLTVAGSPALRRAHGRACSATSCSPCSATARSSAPTTDASTCCCSAATPAPVAGACGPTR